MTKPVIFICCFIVSIVVHTLSFMDIKIGLASAVFAITTAVWLSKEK